MARRPLNLDTLPSNNQTTPNVEPVARGTKRQRSQGGMANKLRDIGNALFETIIRPAIENNALDFINEGASMLIKGQKYNVTSDRGKPEPYYRAYRQQKRGVKRAGRMAPPQRLMAQPTEVFEDVYYPTRQEAEAVLGRMMELAVEYGGATIGDLYTLSGITQNITHEDWGWVDLQGVRPQATSHGYVILFPDPVYLR